MEFKTTLFGNRTPKAVSEKDQQRWSKSAKKEREQEQKEKERTRLKKKTFKVGDKVKVTPWKDVGISNKTYKGIITKLNCRVLYVLLDGWDGEKQEDYRNVEKI